MTAALPVTIRAAIVSPTALPIPRIAAAVIPEIAYGIMTRCMVCHLFAPSARLASFIESGVVRIASSEMVMIVGSAMMPSTMLPARPVSPTGKLNTFWIRGTITISPKKPYTTEGIPARSSMSGFMTLLVFSLAISAM